MTTSSASDNSAYPGFCRQAAEDDGIFDTFRQSPVYRQILEHFSYQDGLNYLREIRAENPEILTYIERFKDNDRYGGAALEEYESIGCISPSTLHYIRQLSYLETYFGDLTGKHIVEVGCGYGGLARLVMDKYDIAGYTCYDLEPVMQLTRKYLGKFGGQYLEKIRFARVDEAGSGQEFDIFVSNCAFTECFPEMQDAYLDQVIRRSSSGFILYNKRLESYHPVILLSKLEACGLKGIGSRQLDPPMPTVFIVAWNALVRLNPLPYRRRLVYQLSPVLYRLLLRAVRLFKK